jgi:hypothetical protein
MIGLESCMGIEFPCPYYQNMSGRVCHMNNCWAAQGITESDRSMTCSRTDCPMRKRYGEPTFDPLAGVEGDAGSPIWVIGINQKTNPDAHTEGVPSPTTWTRTNPNASHFRRLRPVLGESWYPALLQQAGIAHTDLLKCGSPGQTDIEKISFSHCGPFLVEQLKKHRPKLVLVVSSHAARYIADQAGFPDDATEGTWQVAPDYGCVVVLSGYTDPRQDHFAKLRVRRDFLEACNRLALRPPNHSVQRAPASGRR